MTQYAVTVVDKRVLQMTVEAEDEDEARRLVESSSDLKADYNAEQINSDWYIDFVREETE